MSLCRSPTLPNQSRARADQGLGLLRTLAVYTGVILGGDDTEDEYHPLKVILVQHEGVWVIFFMLSKSLTKPRF